MLDKRFLLLLGLVVLVAIIFVFWRVQKPAPQGATQQLTIGKTTYTVELATTLIEQARGLSGRESLPAGHGMLFVFAAPSMQAFWMHGMKLPLDFIWINNGTVIGVTENVPARSTDIYRPPAPAELVLEVNAGTVAHDGIKVGDKVTSGYDQ